MKFEPDQYVRINLFDTDYTYGYVVNAVAYVGEYNMHIYRVEVDGDTFANIPEYLLEAATEYDGDTLIEWKELEVIWKPKKL